MEGFQRYQRFNQIVIIGSLYDKIAKFNFSIEELRFLELEFP